MSDKGKRVRHKTYGDGTVSSENGPVLYVVFDKKPGTHTFIAPGCFQKDLKLIPGTGNIKSPAQKNLRKTGKTTSGAAGTQKSDGQTSGGKNVISPSIKSVAEFCDIYIKALNEAENFRFFITRKFSRYMMRVTYSSMHISRQNFMFVPKMGLDTKWTDQKLYEFFSLSEDEISIIEKTMRPMDDEPE